MAIGTLLGLSSYPSSLGSWQAVGSGQISGQLLLFPYPLQLVSTAERHDVCSLKSSFSGVALGKRLPLVEPWFSHL